MERDLNHPSLNVQPIQGMPGLWEARASGSLRISFSFVDPDAIQLHVNCTHDEVYRDA